MPEKRLVPDKVVVCKMLFLVLVIKRLANLKSKRLYNILVDSCIYRTLSLAKIKK